MEAESLEGPSRGLLWTAGILAALFGLATLLEGGRTLFMDPAARPKGVVPFVLIFNFIAGFFYMAAGLGAMTRRHWSLWLARLLALSTALVFIALGVHIALGGEFMRRTLVAMTLRSAFWAGESLFLARYFVGLEPRAQGAPEP